jgi:hypothetical protein
MGTKGITYLGIDGGGTRCRARIEDENGRLLGEASSGPATTRIGVERAWRSVMEASEAAAAQAGLKREDFSRMHAGIGLAGLGRRGAEAALKKIAHPFASVVLISDGMLWRQSLCGMPITVIRSAAVLSNERPMPSAICSICSWLEELTGSRWWAGCRMPLRPGWRPTCAPA